MQCIAAEPEELPELAPDVEIEDASATQADSLDAILGALAKGDIGQHFPDTSEEFGGIDSRILLRHVAKLIEKREKSPKFIVND